MSLGNIITPAEVEFWLDFDKYAHYLPIDSGDPENQGIFSIDMVRLSSIRKAISNFVRILTRKNIPIYFNDMDANVNFGGKTIYISAALTCKADFDVAVGLALHEGAHTLLTDFDMAKAAWANIPPEIFKESDAKHIRRASIEKFVRDMWNVIEDRYIDNYVFNEAPGYRGYYAALYERYWHCDEVDEQLKSDNFRYPSLKSYDFRISSFINENTDLLALPRLEEIAQVVDISGIERLKTTQDRVENAFEITKIVLDCLDKDSEPSGIPVKGKLSPKKSSGLADPHDYFDFGEEPEEEETPEKEDGKSDKDDDTEIDVGQDAISEVGDILSGRNDKPEELKENKDIVGKVSDEELDKEAQKEINKVVDLQNRFLNGDIKKSEVSDYQKALLDLIEKHGIVLVRVDLPSVMSGDDKNMKVDCIVVQKMTKELIFSGNATFPLCDAMKMGTDEPDPPKRVADAVKKGIQLGTRLGRKLQIRAEENPIQVIRKKSGKINKRQLHEAAFDAEDLFYRVNIDRHNEANLHISVDSSSSMQGEKWERTMTAVVAICKAASMIDNVHVTVSFRSTQQSVGTTLPYVVLAYDSKKDKFSKIRKLFPYLVPNGYTPEGLAFGAIMHLFEDITPDEEDRYFLNLSDGEPCYYLQVPDSAVGVDYEGDVGVVHTKYQIDKIRRHGVQILSYFIEDLDMELINKDLKSNFRRMYGKTAQFIDVESVVQLAKTINDLFLSNGNEKKN